MPESDGLELEAGEPVLDAPTSPRSRSPPGACRAARPCRTPGPGRGPPAGRRARTSRRHTGRRGRRRACRTAARTSFSSSVSWESMSMMSSGLARVGALIAGSPRSAGRVFAGNISSADGLLPVAVASQARTASSCSPRAGGGPGSEVRYAAQRTGCRTCGAWSGPTSTSGSRPSEVARSMAAGMVWTGPAGTPAAVSRCTHEAAPSRASAASSVVTSASRCATRAAFVAKSGVLGQVGHTDDLGEPGELAVVAAGHRDEPVRAAEGLVGRDTSGAGCPSRPERRPSPGRPGPG